jgi:hypothetical protein
MYLPFDLQNTFQNQTFFSKTAAYMNRIFVVTILLLYNFYSSDSDKINLLSRDWYTRISMKGRSDNLFTMYLRARCKFVISGESEPFTETRPCWKWLTFHAFFDQLTTWKTLSKVKKLFEYNSCAKCYSI